MTDSTATIRSRYTEARDRLHALAGPLSDEAFNWKPSPKRWSIGECIVHLNIIGKAYAPAMREAAEASPPGAGPFRYGFVSRRFIAAVRPGSRPIPTGGPMKPPATTGSRSEIDKARALAGLDRATDALVAAADAADGKDLTAVKVPSPFLRLMRLPVGAFLEAMGLHALRHTVQAERVAEVPGFPGQAGAEGTPL